MRVNLDELVVAKLVERGQTDGDVITHASTFHHHVRGVLFDEAAVQMVNHSLMLTGPLVVLKLMVMIKHINYPTYYLMAFLLVEVEHFMVF